MCASAEEALQTAIAVAQASKGRAASNSTQPSRSPSSTNRPLAPLTRAHRSRPRPRRLCADAGNAGDRRGAGADGASGAGPFWADTKPSLPALVRPLSHTFPPFGQRSLSARSRHSCSTGGPSRRVEKYALEVQPDRLLNDLRREAIPAVAQLVHPRWLPGHREPRKP